MNSNKKDILKKLTLTDYGEFISVYSGCGTLSIVGGAGEKPQECSFEAGQRIDGNIILLCQDLPPEFPFLFLSGREAKKFKGKTKEGYSVRSNESKTSLLQISYPKSKIGLYDQNLALRLTELSINYSEEKCFEVRFGICNFKFDENDTIDKGNKSDKVILPIGEENIEISFKKVNDYDDKINRISTFKTIDVTCELVLKISNGSDLSKLITLIGGICFLLSVKNGTKISWIYYDICQKNGESISRKHALKVTKAYQPLNIYYLKEPRTVQTKEFLEATYPHYLEYRDLFKLNSGVIDAFLDAKAENDFLETRAGKMALAIEFLKNEYLMSQGQDSEFIIPPENFKKCSQEIQPVMIKTLKLHDLTENGKIQAISDINKINGLNRRSFSNIFKQLVKQFQVNITNDEISLFTHCRNSLVHRGNFYCKTFRPEEKKRCEPLLNYKFEYFFMVNILDRIFLRILGQDDKMIKVNWRNPPERISEWLK